MEDFETEVARIHRRYLLRKLAVALFAIVALATGALMAHYYA